MIGATPYERTPDRLAQHNGHRGRVLSTTAGDLELRIPKLRAGSFFPSLLERRRRVDHALFCDQQRKEDQQLHVQPLRWLGGAMSRAANAPTSSPWSAWEPGSR